MQKYFYDLLPRRVHESSIMMGCVNALLKSNAFTTNKNYVKLEAKTLTQF